MNDQAVKPWWHELNTWQPDDARAFYGRTLGWKFDDVDLPDGSPYWIARRNGEPVGGIFALCEPVYAGIPSHWMTYMTVADIGHAERTAVFAGGEVMRPAIHIPGVGKLAVVSDSVGALIGLIEPDPQHALAAAQ
jgi:predicted enzyme related to lactoylglutathione lyase